MGVGNSVVVNKTPKKICVITFNYADIIYGSFENVYILLPGESKNVETTVANDKGLKVGVVYDVDRAEKEFLFQLWKVKNETVFTITTFNGSDISTVGDNITSMGKQKTQGVKDEASWEMAIDALSVQSTPPGVWSSPSHAPMPQEIQAVPGPPGPPASYIPGPPGPPSAASGPSAVLSPPVSIPMPHKKKGSNSVPSPVRLAGATGYNAPLVNGLYEPTSVICGKSGLPVYIKIGELNQSLVFVKGSLHGGYWRSKGSKSHNAGQPAESYGQGYCTLQKTGLPESCSPGKWEIAETGGDTLADFKKQASVTISIVSQSEVEAYRAWIAAETARVIIGTKHLRMVGGNGCAMDKKFWKDVFEPTNELRNGVTVYRNMDSGELLVFDVVSMQWQILTVQKPNSAVGNIPYARCTVPVKCLPEDCPAGQWARVAESGNQWSLKVEPTCALKVISPQEAEELSLQVVYLT